MGVGNDRDVQDVLRSRRRAFGATFAGVIFGLTVAATRNPVAAVSAATDDGQGVQPRLVVSHLNWRSKSGTCTAEIQRASVEGIPAKLKPRVNATLASALRAQTMFARVSANERDVACRRLVKDDGDEVSDLGRPLAIFERIEWTMGLARGRWLSVRLHDSFGSSHAAHPEDVYASYTFDLTHGGYPVPTRGFYTKSQRSRLNAAIFAAEMRTLADLAKQDPAQTVPRDYVKSNAEGLTIEAPQILLTETGIEVTGVDPSEAARNLIVAIPFSDLTGVGTTGGPLDPATR